MCRKVPLERARKPQDRREGLGWYLEASGELDGLESPVTAPSVDFPIWETVEKFLRCQFSNRGSRHAALRRRWREYDYKKDYRFTGESCLCHLTRCLSRATACPSLIQWSPRMFASRRHRSRWRHWSRRSSSVRSHVFPPGRGGTPWLSWESPCSRCLRSASLPWLLRATFLSTGACLLPFLLLTRVSWWERRQRLTRSFSYSSLCWSAPGHTSASVPPSAGTGREFLRLCSFYWEVCWRGWLTSSQGFSRFPSRCPWTTTSTMPPAHTCWLHSAYRWRRCWRSYSSVECCIR